MNVAVMNPAAGCPGDHEQFHAAAAYIGNDEKQGWKGSRNEIMKGLLGFAKDLGF